MHFLAVSANKTQPNKSVPLTSINNATFWDFSLKKPP